MSKLKIKTEVTLDDIMDKVIGKKGTKARNKFDRDSQKQTKKDMKNVIKGKETLIDTDVIKRKDLQGLSYEKMLEKTYGKKGTPTRIAYEQRVKARAKKILSDIREQEAKEKEQNGKPKKSGNSVKSIKVPAKRSSKKGIDSKIRKDKKKPVGQTNSKKRKGIK